jgi:plasmid stabilization system protein ParE
MHKKLIWSPLAENDFANILEYLQLNWENKVLENFIEITDRMISQIVLNPKQFPIISKKHKIRKRVLTKHNTLFYKISLQSIQILRIYDTRQDPRKLKFE